MWLIPYRALHLALQEHAKLALDFCSAITAGGKFQSFLLGRGKMEVWIFWALMSCDKPTLGMMDLLPQMSPVARSDSKSVSKVRSWLSASSSSTGSTCKDRLGCSGRQ